jgi:LacI family transcriptional regulator
MTDGLRSGPAARRAANLRDVAARANVHVSVASRVLNETSGVSFRDETRSRIFAAARQLNYRPNALGRGLRLQRTMTLAMVVPNISGAVSFEIIQGAERQAAEAGYVMLLADADEFTHTSEALKRLLYEGRADGLVVASATSDEKLPAELNREALPYVVVNRMATGLGPNVIENDEAGVELGVRHLAGLGHVSIAHIAGPPSADTGVRRLLGYRSALDALELPAAPERIISGPFTEAGGYEAMQRLLALSPRPTAVSVSSLSAAIGALAAVRDAGLRVPHDISVVGFHDATIAEYVDPPLTTIHMPLAELGALAVQCLIRLIGGASLPETTKVTSPPELVRRRSTAPPPG